ncbi:MAG: hypothetical protein E7530_08610 [Ruminococcaceae bacterium]|nr:hypothetical protein [Oscillospiraceae bacterium]
MSKTRKLISVLVALMMVVSMFALTANAAGYEDDETAAIYTQEWALGEPVDNGDGTYTVDVYLTTNYATGPIQFVLTNSDTSVAAIDSVTLGDAIPETYNATVSVSKAKGKVMIIADTAGVATIEAEAIDGVIATVVYTYSGEGSAEIAIDDNAKSATNVAGTLIAARMSDDNLVTGNPITGQTVTVGDSVIIGGGAAPELAVIDGTIGVIDTSRQDMYCDESEAGMGDATFTGYIYGVEPEYAEGIDAVFEVVGDGYMSIVANEAGSEAGTGTVVEVYDNSDNLVATYVLVIFGDVNGDGMVDAVDSGDIELHDGWAYEMSSNGMRFEYAYQAFAADVNCDAMADAVDSGDIELHDGYAYEMGSDGMRMYQSDVIANIA